MLEYLLYMFFAWSIDDIIEESGTTLVVKLRHRLSKAMAAYDSQSLEYKGQMHVSNTCHLNLISQWKYVFLWNRVVEHVILVHD